jgi:hypothetical protein
MFLYNIKLLSNIYIGKGTIINNFLSNWFILILKKKATNYINNDDTKF